MSAHYRLRAVIAPLLLGLLLIVTRAASASTTIDPAAHFRRPVALVIAGDRLFIANQRSGGITLIDRAHSTVLGEFKIGNQLADLAMLPNGDLLAVDQAAGQLVRVRVKNDVLHVVSRLPIGYSPVSVCVSPDGGSCSVSLLWAHQLALAAIHPDATLSLRKTIDLPFAPRKQLLLPDGKTLIVADSFGHDLAVIDVATGTIRAIRSIEGHNIRGLALTADGAQLLLAHPILTQTLATTESNIFWGSVMANDIRAVELRHVLHLPPPVEIRDPSNPIVPIGHWSLYNLGEQNNAAGDPGALVVCRDGSVIVALAGVNEVAIGSLRTGQFTRLPVGDNPTAVALAPDDRTLYVANTLDDSISVVDCAALRVIAKIPLGPEPALSSADRGERLFHNSRLSKDGWYSCNTCHTDGYTCGLLNDNFSDGSFGTPKRILSLGGCFDTAPYAWNASNPTLEDQIRHSIETTMHGKPPAASNQNVADLSAYLRTLSPAPSLSMARNRLDMNAIARGRRAFEQWDCDHCHQPPSYTSPKTYDVNLPDELGQLRWNPPSLRGVSQLPAFFHDNRAATLQEVLTKFKHPHGDDLPPDQVEDLVAFLDSL